MSAKFPWSFRPSPRGGGPGAFAAAVLLITAGWAGPWMDRAAAQNLPALRPPNIDRLARARNYGSAREDALKIGFLASGADAGEARPAMEELRRRLLRDPEVAAALKERGYEDIWPRPSDEPYDLFLRLRAGEFEVAFAGSALYARLVRPEGVAGGPGPARGPRYAPVLQFRRPGDREIPGGGVLRRGVIFIGPGSRLWGKDPTPEEIRAELEREPMAAPDAYSAAGHVYPRLRLREAFGRIALRTPVFCRTPEEVVKHVVSGLTAAGACEARVLEGPLAAPRAGGAPLVRELFRTEAFPSDPVLFRDDLAEKGSPTPLGLVVKKGIEAFFNGPGGPGPNVVAASAEMYEPLLRALDRFDEREPN